LSEKGEQDL